MTEVTPEDFVVATEMLGQKPGWRPTGPSKAYLRHCAHIAARHRIAAERRGMERAAAIAERVPSEYLVNAGEGAMRERIVAAIRKDMT